MKYISLVIHYLFVRYIIEDHCKILQCPPLNGITLGRIESDNINRMIQLTEDTFLPLKAGSLIIRQNLQNTFVFLQYYVAT